MGLFRLAFSFSPQPDIGSVAEGRDQEAVAGITSAAAHRTEEAQHMGLAAFNGDGTSGGGLRSHHQSGGVSRNSTRSLSTRQTSLGATKTSLIKATVV